jgi:membrane associated rhomboid family serine protease
MKEKAGKPVGQKHNITWSLIIANVVVFLIVFSFPEATRTAIFEALYFSGGTMFQAWRWITSMFLHASASHLFFNMIGLYFFGKILEEEVKKEWYLAIYFLAGVLGNFVFMFTSQNPVVGASGAIFGVMGAVMLLKPTKKINLYVVPLPLGVVALAFALVETMVVYFEPALAPDNVAHMAHVAGLVTGAIFAYFYNPKQAAKGTFILFACILLMILLGPIFSFISGIGGLILGVIDSIVGFLLYGIAGIIGLLWG